MSLTEFLSYWMPRAAPLAADSACIAIIAAMLSSIVRYAKASHGESLGTLVPVYFFVGLSLSGLRASFLHVLLMDSVLDVLFYLG